jgi:hypothetical protein
MKLFKKFRSIGLTVSLLFIAQLAFAHTFEIRVKQNPDGTLTWYGQSYHAYDVVSCPLTKSGIEINNVKYNSTQSFSGSQVGETNYIYTTQPIEGNRYTYARCYNPIYFRYSEYYIEIILKKIENGNVLQENILNINY